MTQVSYWTGRTTLALAAMLVVTTVFAAPKTDKSAATSPQEESTTSSGTTIMGSDASPIGLYITPWKNDYAERGVARPHYQLEALPEPVDPDTFHRQIEYYDTITAYRKAELAHSAEKPAGKP